MIVKEMDEDGCLLISRYAHGKVHHTDIHKANFVDDCLLDGRREVIKNRMCPGPNTYPKNWYWTDHARITDGRGFVPTPQSMSNPIRGRL